MTFLYGKITGENCAYRQMRKNLMYRGKNSKISSSKSEVLIKIIQSCCDFFRENALVSVALHFGRK